LLVPRFEQRRKSRFPIVVAGSAVAQSLLPAGPGIPFRGARSGLFPALVRPQCDYCPQETERAGLIRVHPWLNSLFPHPLDTCQNLGEPTDRADKSGTTIAVHRF
jgi:hypothetical protein